MEVRPRGDKLRTRSREIATQDNEIDTHDALTWGTKEYHDVPWPIGRKFSLHFLGLGIRPANEAMRALRLLVLPRRQETPTAYQGCRRHDRKNYASLLVGSAFDRLSGRRRGPLGLRRGGGDKPPAGIA